jgi:hypothetical protein
MLITGVWALLTLATGPVAPFHYLVPQ